MSQIQSINISDALTKIEQGSAILVDIRDGQSYSRGRVPNSVHLTNESIADFINDVDYEQPILVMCYHGISSFGAAEYLLNQGYEDVYSVEGGFAAWERASYPIEV